MKGKILMSAFLLSTLSCLLPTNSFAQVPNWLWAKSGSGPSSYDEGLSVSIDYNNNVFITGYFRGPTITFGSITLTNVSSNGDEMFLAKYDAFGNLLWAKSASSPNGNDGVAVSTDANGNVFVTGGFYSLIAFGNIILTDSGFGDSFLVKYNTNGNALWAKSINGGGGYSVNTDENNNVFITGVFMSDSIIIGSTTLHNMSPGTSDMFIAKYDANGNALWAKSAGGTDEDMGYDVATDANGNVFVTGWFGGTNITFGSIVLNNSSLLPGYGDLFIAKYDVNGNILWAKSSTGTDNDRAWSVSTDITGNAFITGYFDSPTLSFASTIITNMGVVGFDAFIAKYDGSGNLLWAKDVGGPGGLDKGFCTSTDTAGNLYVTGGFGSSIAIGTITLTRPPNSNDAFFIAKYDSNGNALCASALASGGDDNSGVCTDLVGNVYVTGDFMVDPFIVGSDTLVSGGGYENVFVAKYSCCALSITISTDTTISLGENTTLTASGGTSYSWSNGANGSSIVVAPTSSTNYCVNVNDGNNCNGIACVEVNVVDECSTDLFMANAFSPNGDGANDFLQVHYKNPDCVNTFYIGIYDRWGEKVFESSDPDFKWDGSYHGKIMYSQVLNYYIRTTLIDGKENLKKGNISLVL